MASKGPKNGSAGAAAPKPVSRARKPAAPTAKVAASKAEKPEPKAAEPAKPTPPLAQEPAAALNAAPQEATPQVADKTEVKTATAGAALAAAQTVTQPAKAAAAEAVTAANASTEAANKEASNMETTIENNVNRTQTMFADMNDRTKAAVEKSTKMVEEMNDFAKGNLEAMVESSRITAKGFESMGQEAAEYGRKSFEQATAALKQLAGAKSPTEFFKLQSDFMRQSFDSYVAEASKNTEAMLKLAGDAAQPLSNRLAVAADKAKTDA